MDRLDRESVHKMRKHAGAAQEPIVGMLSLDLEVPTA